MLCSFIVIITSGQIGCALMILGLVFFIFKEINSIKRNYEKEVNIPMTKYLNWYFYGLANFYCLGNFLLKTFPMMVLNHPTLHLIFVNHNFICYCAFIAGFVSFVLSLKQGYLKYQFKLFAWIILATIMVVFQAWLMIANVMQGLIWFVIPALLININDIFAYLVGYFFGSHQLISLSPKKTWEGYLGGAFFTLIFSYILTHAMVTIPGFTCPMEELDFVPFRYPTCTDSHITTDIYSSSYLPFTVMRCHFHVLVLSLFASTIGPFGGFFASGLKRSIKIKDFSNLIPGHGGVSDRMDCQLIMGSFAYFYLSTFLGTQQFNPGFWIGQLTLEQQLLLFEELKKKFGGIGI
jgi:phosphatidate cytidylyltransferase